MGVLEDPLKDLLKALLKGILKSLLCRLSQVIFTRLTLKLWCDESGVWKSL